jgi:hypothetical protein
MKVAKQIVGTSIRLQNVGDWTLSRLRPLRNEKETAFKAGAGDVGTLSTVGTFARTDRRKMVIKLDRLEP